MNAAEDWYQNGPPCMNCGERVTDAKIILDDDGIVFTGLCKSKVCIKLPPGGNPFTYILSKGDDNAE